jgi:methyl-accepting chemotaxis protein
MTSKWTFGRIMAAGFAAVLLLNLAAGLLAIIGLHSVVASKDRVIRVNSGLQAASEHLLTVRADRAADFRAYLLTRRADFLTAALQDADELDTAVAELKPQVTTARGRALLTQIQAGTAESLQAQNSLIAVVKAGDSNAAVVEAFNNAAPTRIALASALANFSAYQSQLAEDLVARSTRTAERDQELIIGVLAGTVVLTAVLAAFLTRHLRTRISGAVGDVQNSSSELQTTANQQAVGAMEQATAMGEISTTITELLATSRQITESAQRVADVADQTNGAGQAGQATVRSARDSMEEIRRQVDVIVNHMLELGDKSQRIGVVLDIVSELAEQTNILAINSTIEAAGAGESGRRFAVVADEIRKLADRVAESTKEIRALIEVVRNAVHTTVIATELGSKAVDAGTAQFAGVASSFEEIVEMVTTTTEAAREIELSTKQQTIAVEQVNFAVSNVTETTKQSEASSSATLETVAQLTELSTKLRRLVEPATTG